MKTAPFFFRFLLAATLPLDSSSGFLAREQETRNLEAHSPPQQSNPAQGNDQHKDGDKENAPIPPEKLSVTQHDIALHEKNLR
jgi:hypothetical protein